MTPSDTPPAKDQGASAVPADRACAPDGAEPATQSQAKPLVPSAGELPLTERLRMNAEMMSDGWQGPTLTDLWHSHVVRDAAKDATEAADIIEELLEALEDAVEVLGTLAVSYTGEDGWSAQEIERHEQICILGDRLSAAINKALGHD